MDAADVGISAVDKLRDVAVASCASDNAGTALCIYTSVLVFVVMEPHSFCMCTMEDRTTLGQNASLKVLHCLATFSCTLF